MATADSALIRDLNRLHRLCLAGERGFNVVAENVSNRGLKVLLKSYALQRAEFVSELESEIQRLGGMVSDRRSIRGRIHRGRINIRAALTIGAHNVEKTVIGEALVGERTVLRAYDRCLQRDLPSETQTILERQAAAVRETQDRLEQLRGQEEKRLVVRLFDTAQDADEAVEALDEAGFDRSEIEGVEDVRDDVGVYEGEGTTIGESVLSGAIGGAIWGIPIGAAAGVGLQVIPGMEMMVMESEVVTWFSVTMAGVIVGAFFGAILGFLIGTGVTEEDVYLYDDSVKHGRKLLKLCTATDRVMEAEKVLHEVNAAARMH